MLTLTPQKPEVTYLSPHTHTPQHHQHQHPTPHPRIESASSWVLLSFVTNEPQWDLPNPGFYVSFFFFFFPLLSSGGTHGTRRFPG